MKQISKIIISLFFVSCLISVKKTIAQSPQRLSYQAVVRGVDGNLIQNKQISVNIELHSGSIDGPLVCKESHSPTTNANGLFSIEFGDNPFFDGIPWGSNTYYFTTYIDPDGGDNYTISVSSQLLSVPYALHAKTAESISGTITESDPVYKASQAANITANDISKLSSLSGINTGDQDLSGLATISALTDSASILRSAIPDVSGFATQIELSNKVDKEDGKGLSTEDFTSAEKDKVANLSGMNTGDQDLSGLATKTEITLENALTNGNNANQNTIKNVGSISFSSDTTNSNAAIDLSSAGKTFILPYYTTDQRNLLAKKAGTLIYNTDLQKFQGVAMAKDIVLDANHINGVGNGWYIADNKMSNYTHSMENMAQVFQAENSGLLNKISVNMRIYQGTGPYPIKITLKSGGDPSTGTIISTQQISITSSSFAWYDVIFSDSVQLIKGNTYTLLAEFASCTTSSEMYSNNVVEWQRDGGSFSLPVWTGDGVGSCPLTNYSYTSNTGYSWLFKVYVLGDALNWVTLNY